MEQIEVEKAAWNEYHKNPCDETRWQVTQSYQDIVVHCAKKVTKQFGPDKVIIHTGLTQEDLINAGMLVVWNHVEKYLAGGNRLFPSFFYKRLYGEMVDMLRRYDVYPRKVKFEKRVFSYSYEQIFEGSQTSRGQDFAPHAPCPESFCYIPVEADKLLREDYFAVLERLGFCKIDRLVLRLYYFEGLSMSETANAIGICESRVSQIRKNVMQRLMVFKRRIKEYLPD